MRDGDPQGLLEGLKIAAIALDRYFQAISPSFLVSETSFSFGQTPWLMDIVWHLPFGKSMQKIRYRAIDMMRKRIKAAQEIEIQDLASHLVSYTFDKICLSTQQI